MQTERTIREVLEVLEEDPRLQQDKATVFENAPLALIQLALETKINAFKWVLEMKQTSELN